MPSNLTDDDIFQIEEELNATTACFSYYGMGDVEFDVPLLLQELAKRGYYVIKSLTNST